MQRQSSAHLQQVIIKHSLGHLFLSSDIIMGIPTQAKTIPMNIDEVKVRPQVWLINSLKESDATLQIDDLTINIVQSKPPANTLPLPRHPSMRRQEDKAHRRRILTKHWTYLYPETKYIAKHKAIINQSTNRLGLTGISIYSELARRTDC